MMYQKVNNYTWVGSDGKKPIVLPQIQKKKEPEPQKTPRELNTQKYYDFCKSIFEERKFICVKEFNKLIETHFNRNTTYHRKRMMELNFIIETNRVIKPGVEL